MYVNVSYAFTAQAQSLAKRGEKREREKDRE